MDQQSERSEHPVAFGVAALVGVTLVVGLILGLAALGGSRVLGLGATTSPGASAGEATMYLPRPQKTTADTSPEITLAPGPQAGGPSSAQSADDPGTSKKKQKKQKKQANRISLSASQPSVSPMERIDLTGVYPGGEGAILQVQRFEGGRWEDFPVTATVRDQTFSTYVQTGRSGLQRFRVVDSSTGKKSGEVRVRIG